ncbi:MAG: hypothetical protein ABFC96_05775 [Thermoguttaceae bacterium]
MSGIPSLECKPLRRPLGGTLPAGVQRTVAMVGLSLLVSAAAALFFRRMAGALQHPLHPAALLAAALVAIVAAAAIRRSWRCESRSPGRRWSDWIVMVAVSLSVIELTLGLCLPGTPAACLTAICVVVATEEAWAWRRHLRRSAVGPHPSVERGAAALRTEDTQPVDRRMDAVDLADDDAVPPENVIQQLTRSRADDGAEQIAGWLRARFAPGQRTVSIHVAFCPPLESVPEVEVEQVDGPEARIKAAQSLPYGVRLDLKLVAAIDEPASVLLQFSARA